MTSNLLIYATGEGQTARVADRIAGVLREQGLDVDVFDVAALPADVDVDAYDAVLLGGSIHLGKHGDRLTAFAQDHHDTLETRPSGFFQVCLSSAVDDPERRAEADGYLAAFAEATGWDPALTASFGGALRYSSYGFLKRAMMKRIAADATGDTDPSRDYEYTDWDAVERFAGTFAGLIADASMARPSPGAAAEVRP